MNPSSILKKSIGSKNRFSADFSRKEKISLRFRLPEAVLIAEFINLDGLLITAKSKACFGLVSGLEELALAFLALYA